MQFLYQMQPSLTDCSDNDGHTALFAAASNGYMEAVQWLSEIRPKQLHQPNVAGVTPLMFAKRYLPEGEITRFLADKAK